MAEVCVFIRTTILLDSDDSNGFHYGEDCKRRVNFFRLRHQVSRTLLHGRFILRMGVDATGSIAGSIKERSEAVIGRPRPREKVKPTLV